MRILFRRGGLRVGLPWVLVAVAAGLAGLAGVTASPVAGSTVATGTLDMNTPLPLVSRLGACELAATASECAGRTVGGPFPGLGQVTTSYMFQVDASGSCPDGFGKALAYPIRLEVAGKGAIDVAVSEGTCTNTEAIRTQTQAFAVTGGTGIYAGASGSGTLSAFEGALHPFGLTATRAGTVDAAASPDGRFLYVQTGGVGGVDAFRVGRDGGLTPAGTVTVPGAAGGEGIAVS